MVAAGRLQFGAASFVADDAMASFAHRARLRTGIVYLLRVRSDRKTAAEDGRNRASRVCPGQGQGGPPGFALGQPIRDI